MSSFRGAAVAEERVERRLAAILCADVARIRASWAPTRKGRSPR